MPHEADGPDGDEMVIIVLFGSAQLRGAVRCVRKAGLSLREVRGLRPSALVEIPGIGESRQRALLHYFATGWQELVDGPV
jgi:hypothetical protein